MQSIIEVFRMIEVKPETRIRIIEKLGRAINDEHSMNITEELVAELVALLQGQIVKD